MVLLYFTGSPNLRLSDTSALCMLQHDLKADAPRIKVSPKEFFCDNFSNFSVPLFSWLKFERIVLKFGRTL